MIPNQGAPPPIPPPGGFPVSSAATQGIPPAQQGITPPPNAVTVTAAPAIVQQPHRPGVWIYIGGYDEKVKDSFLEQVFGLVGNLQKWSSAINPLTDKSLGFGFGEFATALDAAKAVYVLNGLELPNGMGNLTAKLDSSAKKKELTPEEEAEAEPLKEKAKFFLENFGSNMLAENTKETKNEKEKQRSEKDLEEVTEEEIKAAVRIEQKPLDVPDEIWNDIVEFRRMQAKQEIINDRKRERILLRELAKLEKEREIRKQEEEKQQNKQEKPMKQKRAEPIVQSKSYQHEKVDYSLKKDVNLQSLDLKFESKRQKKAIIANEDADEDETKKRPKLVPLEYTEEERAAARTVSERIADVAARINQTATSENSGASKENRILQRIKELVENYIGEAEESLVSFVSEKVKSQTPALELEASLKDVLEEDAQEFVEELYGFIKSLDS